MLLCYRPPALPPGRDHHPGQILPVANRPQIVAPILGLHSIQNRLPLLPGHLRPEQEAIRLTNQVTRKEHSRLLLSRPIKSMHCDRQVRMEAVGRFHCGE